MSYFSTSQALFVEFCDNIKEGVNMIGKALKYMRIQNNLSQEKISMLTNIGRTTLSDYEREKTDISFENIEKIAKMCNYEIIFKNKKTKETFKTKDLERKDI